MASTMCGTAAYMAPETLEDIPSYNHKADLWSLGCVFYEMCTLKRAFSGGRKSIIEKISRGEYETAQDEAVRDHQFLLAEIIPTLIELNPNKRINAETIIVR